MNCVYETIHNLGSTKKNTQVLVKNFLWSTVVLLNICVNTYSTVPSGGSPPRVTLSSLIRIESNVIVFLLLCVEFLRSSFKSGETFASVQRKGRGRHRSEVNSSTGGKSSKEGMRNETGFSLR